MRRALVIVIAGCGRLGFNSEPAPPPDAQSVVEAAPEVCMQLTWPTVTFDDLAIDLSVIETPSGVRAVWAPKAGGDLLGVDLASSWTSATPTGSLKPGSTWFSSSVGYLNGMLVMGESEGSSVKLDTADTDLSSVSEIACPDGSLVSKPPFVQAGPDVISPTGWDSGLTVNPFGADWTALPIDLYVPSNPATAITAVSIGGIAEVVWSTATACFVEQLSDHATGTVVPHSQPCASPRLAASATELVLVFEGATGVELSRAATASLSPDVAQTISTGGSSPRVAYDGVHFWISYLDGHGEIVAGYLGTDGALHSVTVAATPTHDAYELAVANGAPWLFVVDAAGLTGHRLCVP